MGIPMSRPRLAACFLFVLAGPVAGTPGPAADRAADAPRDRLDVHGHLAVSAADRLGNPVTSGIGRGVTAQWSALGPPGGDVSDVAASPADGDVVIAALALATGGGGAYRSADGGATWTPIPALAGRASFHIEFAPDGTAYLGTQDGVWISEDAGLTWTALNLGIGPNDTVLSIAIDPSDPDTIWAGTSESFGQQPVNLLRSTDGGITWSNRTPPLDVPMNGNAIAVDPGDSDTVVAAFSGDFGGGSVWVSTDGGDTWSNRSAGLPANPMRALHHDGERILLGGGQLFGSQFVGLYASDDLGATWTMLHDASWPLRVVTDIAVDPIDPDRIWVATDGTGIHRSNDGGATWATGIGGSGNLATQSVRFVPDDADRILLGVSSLAVFRSSDGGESFAQSADGISELNLFSIDANPLDPQEVAVAFQGNNNGGVLLSSDGGASWTPAPVPATRYRVVRFDADGKLYALSTGPTSVAPEGLYRREGDGTWTNIGPDQGPAFESDLATVRISDDDPQRIWLGGSDFGVAGFEQTIWYTGDGGASWTKQYEGGDNLVTTDIEIVDDGAGQELVAAYDDASGGNLGGALRTDDAGANWVDASAGLPAAFHRMPRLCRPADAGDTVLMSAWTGWSTGAVYRSDDRGATWTATPWTGSAINDIACDVSSAGTVYIAAQGSPTVLRSDDGAASFAPFDAGLAAAGDPRELRQHPEGALYLATSRGSFGLAAGEDDTIFADGFEAEN